MGGGAVIRVEQLDVDGGVCVCVCLCGGWCFMCGSAMQINDLLQCRAEQHNTSTPVHHSASPVPLLQAG